MKYGTKTFCAVVLTACFFQAQLSATDYFKISVVDEQTGRGVPLIELKTVSNTSWWTDSNGIIAFDEPGLMGQEVFFSVRGHGYEYPKDFLDFRGVKLRPARGASATVKVRRVNIAERLYRVTGEGIYRDSLLTGVAAPTRLPLLNAQVTGQDTVIAAPYRGKIYWFWGDTNRVGYPLGHFGASGATSELPGSGGLSPDFGVDLTYFADASGFSKQMCPLPGQKEGMRWIEGLLTVPDEQGRERLVARVANMRDLGYAYDWHLMAFNDEKAFFESVRRWDIHEGHDSAHPFRADVAGVSYFYLYPNWRVRADFKTLFDLENYEAFTCVVGDGKVSGVKTAIDRDGEGRPRYSWKKGADRLYPEKIRELIAAGILKPEESWIDLHDAATGARIQAGRSSVYWNAFRRRWVMLISAQPGEIWFAEGDTPTGPWAYARRIVAHDNYNFYNPTQHPFFDQENGRLIYFEGTYTDSFSGAKEKTPRYEYNQVMYRLTLDDPRLSLPAPVYRLKDGRYLMREGVVAQKAWSSIEEAAFYAVPPARTRAGLVPVFAVPGGGLRLHTGSATPNDNAAAPLFLAFPPEADTAPGPDGSVNGLWRCTAKTTTDDELKFDLNLTQTGMAVEATEMGIDGTSGQGLFAGGKLALTVVATADSTFTLTAVLKDGGLAGEWKQLGGSEFGSWSAKLAEPNPGDDGASTIAVLYEYEQQDGTKIYSTNSVLGGNLKRAAKPLCRVWRNPMTALALDPAAPAR